MEFTKELALFCLAGHRKGEGFDNDINVVYEYYDINIRYVEFGIIEDNWDKTFAVYQEDNGKITVKFIEAKEI